MIPTLSWVRTCADLNVCPVKNLYLYVHFSEAMGINLRDGYLFRTSNNKGQITGNAFQGSAVGNRLKRQSDHFTDRIPSGNSKFWPHK